MWAGSPLQARGKDCHCKLGVKIARHHHLRTTYSSIFSVPLDALAADSGRPSLLPANYAAALEYEHTLMQAFLSARLHASLRPAWQEPWIRDQGCKRFERHKIPWIDAWNGAIWGIIILLMATVDFSQFITGSYNRIRQSNFEMLQVECRVLMPWDKQSHCRTCCPRPQEDALNTIMRPRACRLSLSRPRSASSASKSALKSFTLASATASWPSLAAFSHCIWEICLDALYVQPMHGTALIMINFMINLSPRYILLIKQVYMQNFLL